MSTTNKQQKGSSLGVMEEQGLEEFENGGNQPQSAVIGFQGNAFFKAGRFKKAV